MYLAKLWVALAALATVISMGPEVTFAGPGPGAPGAGTPADSHWG